MNALWNNLNRLDMVFAAGALVAGLNSSSLIVGFMTFLLPIWWIRKIGLKNSLPMAISWSFMVCAATGLFKSYLVAQSRPDLHFMLPADFSLAGASLFAIAALYFGFRLTRAALRSKGTDSASGAG